MSGALEAAAAGGSVAGRLAGELLAGALSPHTRRAYEQGLRRFAAWIGEGEDVAAALARLLGAGVAEAHLLVGRYRAELSARGAAPATVNLRLAALRAVLRLARICGVISWQLEVRGLRVRALRDTRGPGLTAVTRMLEQAAGHGDPERGARDTALVRLLFDVALRRGEVLGLSVDDVDLADGRCVLWVRAKGATERLAVVAPASTREALVAWLALRGETEERALFLGLGTGPGGRGAPLSGSGLYKLIRRLGAGAGVRTRPHGLRHTAITTAVERIVEWGGRLPDVLEFSRHARGSLALLMTYFDRVGGGHQGQIAAQVARQVGGAIATPRLAAPAPAEGSVEKGEAPYGGEAFA